MAARDASYLLLGLLVTLFTCGVWAKIEVNMEDRVEVVRGETARITCLFNSSEGVGGMMIQWSYVTRTKERQRIFYKDATMTVIDKGTPFTERISVNGTGATGEVVLTINDVKLEDELEFICFIKGLTVGTGEGRTKLKVFESPDLPSIEEVQTGISINEVKPSKVGTCEVKNGFPKPNITWYRNNTPLQNVPDLVDVRHSVTTESTGLFSVKTDLILKVMKQHKDDTFYCEVTYFVPGGTRMTETKRIKIPVFYPPTAVRLWVESPKGKIKEGDNIELHCMDNGHPQSSYISIRHAGGQYETVDQKIMRLPNVTRQHSGLYECTSTYIDTFENISGNTTVFVNYLDEAVIRPQDTLVVDQGKEVTATCNALSSLLTQTVWTKNGETVSEGHTLTIKNASFGDAGNYLCKVNVLEIEEMEVSRFLVLNIAGSPEILKPDTTEIISNEATVDLTCIVRGFPTPKVTWTTSDGQDLKYSLETTEEGEQSKVSIQLDSDITAFCNASNKYGTDSVTFNIKTTVNTTPAPVTTTTTTTTATTTVTSRTISSPTDKPKETNSNSKEKLKKESRGVIIAVIIICILLLAVLGSVLYFLYKRGKICGRSGKQDLTKEKSSKDNIVVEMKSENTEEAVLLGVNGEKQPPNDQ